MREFRTLENLEVLALVHYLTPSMASSLPKVPQIRKQHSHSEQHSITTILTRQPLRKESGSDEDVMVIEHDSSEATSCDQSGEGAGREYVRTSSAYFETNRFQKSSKGLPQGDEDGGTTSQKTAKRGRIRVAESTV